MILNGWNCKIAKKRNLQRAKERNRKFFSLTWTRPDLDFRISDFGRNGGKFFRFGFSPEKNEKGPQGNKTTFSTFAFPNDVVDVDGDGVGMTGNRTNTSQTRHAPLVTPTSLIFIETAVDSFDEAAFTCRNLARTNSIGTKIQVELFISSKWLEPNPVLREWIKALMFTSHFFLQFFKLISLLHCWRCWRRRRRRRCCRRHCRRYSGPCVNFSPTFHSRQRKQWQPAVTPSTAAAREKIEPGENWLIFHFFR